MVIVEEEACEISRASVLWTICGTRANGDDERQGEKGRA